MVRCLSCCYFLQYLGEKEWGAGVTRRTHEVQCQRFPKPIHMDKDDDKDNYKYQDCPAYQNAAKDIEHQTW